MVQDSTPPEEAQLAPAEVNDSELEQVSGGQAEWDGAEMEVQQDGGGQGTAGLRSNPPR